MAEWRNRIGPRDHPDRYMTLADAVERLGPLIADGFTTEDFDALDALAQAQRADRPRSLADRLLGKGKAEGPPRWPAAAPHGHEAAERAYRVMREIAAQAGAQAMQTVSIDRQGQISVMPPRVWDRYVGLFEHQAVRLGTRQGADRRGAAKVAAIYALQVDVERVAQQLQG